MAGAANSTRQWCLTDPKFRGVQVPRGEQKSSMNTEESMYFLASAEMTEYVFGNMEKVI